MTIKVLRSEPDNNNNNRVGTSRWSRRLSDVRGSADRWRLGQDSGSVAGARARLELDVARDKEKGYAEV